MSLDRRQIGVVLLWAALGASGTPAMAARVRLYPPVHHDGQTFLTWTSVNGPGWTYRAYRSDQPIKNSNDLDAATLVGAVSDSTWCDRRLSRLTGVTYGLTIDSLATPLAPDAGVFVVTPQATGNSYYAVTAQAAGSGEEKSITPGWNTLSDSVAEQLASPRPVYQRTLPVAPGLQADIYTLWTTDQPTALFPAMANRASMPFDCAVVRGGMPPQSSLLVSMHARGGTFLDGVHPTGTPGEWVLALDDPLETRDVATFWYGYDTHYDILLNSNPVALTGSVQNYTLRRVLHTLLWARRCFPIDSTRVYTSGVSMGAIGSMLVASRRPDLIAGVMAIAGKFDFSFVTDPDPASLFNPGNVLRDACDRLWGPVSYDLPSSEGFGVFEELNLGYFIGSSPYLWLPPLIAFNGKNDLAVGWAEKLPFLQAMQANHQGGTFFWDGRDHLNNGNATWSPMQDPTYLYRFRTDRSFPALTSCSADGDPGDGSAASGDSVGTINGCLEWDTTLVDQHATWETTLRLRDLTTLWGQEPAPESLTVDVTPRRLQAFAAVADSAYAWAVTRLEDSVVVQSGIVNADPYGRITVPGVKVFRSGSRLTLQALGDYTVPTTDVGPFRPPARRPEVLLAPNPARALSTVRVSWPRRGEARVDLFDAGGRLVRPLFRGPAPDAVMLRVDSRPLPAGLYFVVASQNGLRSVKRLVVLH